jgi:replicative DNA helicase
MNMPPQNSDIEKNCLSCGILSLSALTDIASELKDDDFYYDNHKTFFRCLKELNIAMPDFKSIQSWYKKNGLQITPQFYMEIFENSASSANVHYYITELKKLSNARQIIKLSQNAIEQVHKKINPEDVSIELLQGIREINHSELIKIYSSEELFKDKTIKDFSFKPEDYIKTGIQDFDENFFGLYKSELVLITGRPATGKSALAMNIAMNQTEPVLYVSLEMPEKFFKIRMLSRESMVNSMKIQHNWKITDIEKEKIEDAIKKLSERKLYVIDKSGLKKETIDSKVRQFYNKNKFELLVIDYLQIMGTSSNEQRYIRIGEDLLALKNIGRDLNIPVIVISSKSRGSENSKDLLSGFSESGKIEYEADKAIFLEYENWEENVANESVQGKIILAKNKNGAIGNAPIIFYKQYSKFI